MQLKRKPLNPPRHLKRPGRDLWRGVMRQYGIDDSAGMTLLATACACVDRMRAAQKLIDEHGETVKDRYDQIKVNPACALEKDARNGLIAAIRAMNLDIEPLRDKPGRPPG